MRLRAGRASSAHAATSAAAAGPRAASAGACWLSHLWAANAGISAIKLQAGGPGGSVWRATWGSIRALQAARQRPQQPQAPASSPNQLLAVGRAILQHILQQVAMQAAVPHPDELRQGCGQSTAPVWGRPPPAGLLRPPASCIRSDWSSRRSKLLRSGSPPCEAAPVPAQRTRGRRSARCRLHVQGSGRRWQAGRRSQQCSTGLCRQ